MRKPKWPAFSEGLRSFKEGLDKKLIYAYWLAAWGRAWEIWWGAGVIGVICTVVTIYYAPSRWILGWAVAWVFLVAGYFTWRADHVRLQQKIEVAGVRTHSWPHRDGGTGTQYYFGVLNQSEAETTHNVRVQLMEIIPAIENHDWLPIPLHLQHDNPLSGVPTQSFDLHPREPRNIDLFTTSSTRRNLAHIAHTVSGVDLRVPINGRCRLRVMVNAEDVPVLFVWFTVWMDEDGTLQCEIDPVTASTT